MSACNEKQRNTRRGLRIHTSGRPGEWLEEKRGREIIFDHTLLASVRKIEQKAGISGSGLHGPNIGKNRRDKTVFCFFHLAAQNQCARRTRNREINHCALVEEETCLTVRKSAGDDFCLYLWSRDVGSEFKLTINQAHQGCFAKRISVRFSERSSWDFGRFGNYGIEGYKACKYRKYRTGRNLTRTFPRQKS